jgi:hypothetical protein
MASRERLSQHVLGSHARAHDLMLAQIERETKMAVQKAKPAPARTGA